jgi:hypothetical protein
VNRPFRVRHAHNFQAAIQAGRGADSRLRRGCRFCRHGSCSSGYKIAATLPGRLKPRLRAAPSPPARLSIFSRDAPRYAAKKGRLLGVNGFDARSSRLFPVRPENPTGAAPVRWAREPSPRCCFPSFSQSPRESIRPAHPPGCPPEDCGHDGTGAGGSLRVGRVLSAAVSRDQPHLSTLSGPGSPPPIGQSAQADFVLFVGANSFAGWRSVCRHPQGLRE